MTAPSNVTPYGAISYRLDELAGTLSTAGMDKQAAQLWGINDDLVALNMSDAAALMKPYVTIAQLDHTWGVGRLIEPDNGGRWVEQLRRNLRFEDAADLRDLWNQRGNHERP